MFTYSDVPFGWGGRSAFLYVNCGFLYRASIEGACFVIATIVDTAKVDGGRGGEVQYETFYKRTGVCWTS